MCLYDNADMPSSAHNLLWMIYIAMATCQHIARYQVDLKYVKGNTPKCQRLAEQNNKGYIFYIYMYMKIIGKLLGHVTM